MREQIFRLQPTRSARDPRGSVTHSNAVLNVSRCDWGKFRKPSVHKGGNHPRLLLALADCGHTSSYPYVHFIAIFFALSDSITRRCGLPQCEAASLSTRSTSHRHTTWLHMHSGTWHMHAAVADSPKVKCMQPSAFIEVEFKPCD